jgi:hypothetical protein
VESVWSNESVSPRRKKEERRSRRRKRKEGKEGRGEERRTWGTTILSRTWGQ